MGRSPAIPARTLQERYNAALNVSCPICKAHAGHGCIDRNTGQPVSAPSHHEACNKASIAEGRYRAAMLFDCPVCGRPTGQRCENRRTGEDAAVPHPPRMAIATEAEVTPEDRRRLEYALTATCPTCEAPPQMPCCEDGRDRKSAHYDRIAIVIRALSYLPMDERRLPASGSVDRLPKEIREHLLSQIAAKHAWDERSRIHEARSRLVQEFWDDRREALAAGRASQHWSELGREVRERAGGPVCEKCGCRGGSRYDRDRPPVQLHHLNYERLGKETLEDVILLCSSCHAEEHRSGRAPALSSLEFLDLPEPI